VFNLGMGEITVILLLALIFLGPKKLPELAGGLGKLIREIRKATSDVKNEITLDDSFRKPFEDLRDAVTLHPDELKRRDLLRKEMDEARQRVEEAARIDAENAAKGEGGSVVTPVGGEGADHGGNEGEIAAVGTPVALPGPGSGGIAIPAPGDTIIEPLFNVGAAGHPPATSAPASSAAPAHAAAPAPSASPAATPTAPAAPSSAVGELFKPVSAPLGTVARKPPAAAPAAPPTKSDPNTTQVLSEEDLLAGVVSGGGPPPPPPLPGLVRPPTTPPGFPPGAKKKS
jgi:sec-independent protein translocase protein TatB